MTKEYPWMLGPFEKAAEANPCLVPNAASRFSARYRKRKSAGKPKMYSIPLPLSKTTAFICSTVQKIMRENMPELPVSEWLSVKTDCIFRRCRSLSCILKKTNFPSMNGKEDVKIPGL